MNLTDDRRPEPRRRATALLAALEGDGLAAGAPRLGLTGAPGAGKSTLLDALVRRTRARGESVGVVAVDPSSRRSGGALLGDRIRVRSGARDPGVFLRSLAARDRLGGLAEGARAAVVVLGAAFDRVIVETVGVGQSEGEVAQLVDSLVYVAQPGAGDLLQFMKAGILELPDVLAVNKSDTGPAAERTARELEAGLGLSEARAGGWTPRVVRISARDGQGLDALDEALSAHRAHLETGDRLLARRREGRDAFVREALAFRYGSFGLDSLGGPDAVLARLRAEPDASGFAVLASLGAEIEDALRKPAGRNAP